MTDRDKVKTTLVLDAELYDEFARVIRGIGLRRDTMLNKWLVSELGYLRATCDR